MIDQIQKRILEEVADLHTVPEGAYNIRANGASAGRNTTANIDIVSKTDVSGIDIRIKPGTKHESVHIPVVLSESGIKETVYNDFYIGEDSDIVIVAGCGIHNCGNQDSEHDGIHRFYVGKNAKVKYVEKHYGEGDGNGKRILNPGTEVYMEEGSSMEMEMVQIKGVDSTIRTTVAELAAGARLVVRERLLTHGSQQAVSDYVVRLNGADASADVVSRSVAKDDSYQKFDSQIVGNAKCSGHTECDAIIMGNAKIVAVPQLEANNIDAALIHEAAIGKIAGEQIIKLMTLGLTEEEAGKRGLKVRCGHFSMEENGRSIISGEQDGFIQLVFEAYSNTIVGAQMMCSRATDMIGEIATAIANGLTAEQMSFAMRAQPTYNEGIGAAIADALRKA